MTLLRRLDWWLYGVPCGSCLRRIRPQRTFGYDYRGAGINNCDHGRWRRDFVLVARPIRNGVSLETGTGRRTA